MFLIILIPPFYASVPAGFMLSGFSARPIGIQKVHRHKRRCRRRAHDEQNHNIFHCGLLEPRCVKRRRYQRVGYRIERERRDLHPHRRRCIKPAACNACRDWFRPFSFLLCVFLLPRQRKEEAIVLLPLLCSSFSRPAYSRPYTYCCRYEWCDRLRK